MPAGDPEQSPASYSLDFSIVANERKPLNLPSLGLSPEATATHLDRNRLWVGQSFWFLRNFRTSEQRVVCNKSSDVVYLCKTLAARVAAASGSSQAAQIQGNAQSYAFLPASATPLAVSASGINNVAIRKGMPLFLTGVCDMQAACSC